MVERSLPEAAAFDCDGTIADTESLSEIAWADILRSRGVAWTADDFNALVGRSFEVNWAHFQHRGDLGDADTFRRQLRDRFRALFDEHLDVHDDVVATMHEAAKSRIPIAVVSSSTRDHVERVLERSGVSELVTVVVAAGDTSRHKPAADPYLAACQRLGILPSATAAVEDTPTGARSARAAGLWTVAVRRAHAVAELDEVADLVVDSVRFEHLRIRPSGGASEAISRISER